MADQSQKSFFLAIRSLRYISITQIFCGILGLCCFFSTLVITPIARTYGTVIWMFIDIFLVATGSYGIHCVREVRRGVFVRRTFLVLAILDIILCIVYSTIFVILAIGGALVNIAPNASQTILGLIGLTEEFIRSNPGLESFPDEQLRTVMISVYFVVQVVFLLYVALAASAVHICRRSWTTLRRGFDEWSYSSMSG
ncbi:uncharacterized protein LOC129584135 [Paramacrobiotus metropolitanus]|uniref:uncharacterized protein LOC129584135 n=1 Tax=Paramacrobiotus metropolitanus TaxID=2943436 RepID=UPI0024458BD4|nr:uncharacterized protein LOC129584135 [Paramacrobiotus metropolitanus]